MQRGRDRSLASVIVHFGSLEPTIGAVEAALRFSDQVIVVANDGLESPAGLSPQIEWIVSHRNLGFGEAINQTIPFIHAEIVLIMNTDTIIPQETIEVCLSTFADPKVGIVGPRLDFEDGRLQSGYGTISRRLGVPHARNFVATDMPVPCAWVTGAVMFVRKTTLEEVTFDGSYFLGHEDLDFCLRAGRQGWRVLWDPRNPSVHHQGQVIGSTMWHYYATRNALWFARELRMPGSGLLCRPIRLLNVLRRVLTAGGRVAVADVVRRRGFGSTKAQILGLKDGLGPKPTASEGPRWDEPRWPG